MVGPTFSAGYQMGGFGVWLDFDSMGNRDASHGTFLLSGSFGTSTSGKVNFGGRVGIGTTLVNFDEPAFMDVQGTNMRFEGVIDYGVGSWHMWARPLSIDILTAADLGGPITTYQIRFGAAYQFGGGK